MTLWQFNPSEPCGNPTTPTLDGDSEQVSGGRRCGLCACVPDAWMLTIPGNFPLTVGRPTIDPFYYLQRLPYHAGDPSLALRCEWTDTGNANVVQHADINFQLIYGPLPGANEGALGWSILDWAGNTGFAAEPPTNIFELYQPADPGSDEPTGTIGQYAFFNCLGLNRFILREVVPDRPILTIEPFYG